jgi:hypothetical protein
MAATAVAEKLTVSESPTMYASSAGSKSGPYIRHRENSNSEPFLLEGIGERQADSEGGSGVVVPASGDSGLGLLFHYRDFRRAGNIASGRELGTGDLDLLAARWH